MAEKENIKDKLENLKKCLNELGIRSQIEQRKWKT